MYNKGKEPSIVSLSPGPLTEQLEITILPGTIRQYFEETQ
jgi:hypothetical protein